MNKTHTTSIHNHLRRKSLLQLVLVLCLLLPLPVSSANLPLVDAPVCSLAAPLEPRYADLLREYEAQGYATVPDVQVALSGADFAAQDSANLRTAAEWAGRQGDILLWEDGPEGGWVEWEFDVDADGLYNLAVEYYPLEGKRASIQRDLMLDGAYPFVEARRLVFERTWEDAHPPNVDNQGNDIRPPQQEHPRWRFQIFEDAQGMYREPYLFHLTAGRHRVRLGMIREPMAITRVVLLTPPQVPTYAEVREQYAAAGYRPVGGVQVVVEAEEAVFKSSPTLTRNYSPNPAANPPAMGSFRLNVFGGWRWKHAGERAMWRFTVPEDGLYVIGIKLWQGNWSRLPVYRDLMIDGQYPFDEMREIAFPYRWEWRVDTLSAPDGEPYLFYLTAGEHTLEMKATVGPPAETVRVVEDVTRAISALARQVILLTGAEPDPLMEWDMEREVPDLVPRLTALAESLEGEAARLTAIAGGRRPSSANTLLEVASQLRNMAAKPDTVPNRLQQLSETQSMLGYWALELQQGELEVDSIIVSAPDVPMPPGKATAWAKAKLSTYNFLASFRKEYTVVGNVYGPEDAEKAVVLDVWMARGEEWGKIMKELIEETFTPQSGILVNLHIVPPGSLGAGDMSVLLLAATAGKAPDVACAVNPNLPVEFAIRSALYPMSQFDDYDEVVTRFRPGALIPYQYRGEVYGLPETQNFSMLFYRTDILDSLGLEPPETWDELYDMMWILQQNGFNFYYPPGPDGLTPFLFQHGGDYYTSDGLRSALDSPEALAAFKEWTGLYTNYRIPKYADFFNRFKTGEIPIGVADYWTYVLLSTAARELIGRWAMAPMPGTRLPDGTIDRSTGGSGDAVVIFSQSEHPQEAWKFVKWWTDAETQVRYGIELEALLGVEARWNTANVEALHRMAWPQRDIEAIGEQWQWFRERPVVLGGYFTARHVDNAWNRVVLQGANPRESLEVAVRDINRELRKKQEEFNVE